MIFKLLRQSSQPNRPYPPDTETASTCRVEGLDRVNNPPCALLLASLCRFRCHSHQIYESVT